ncbi:MAG: hypothetical protein KKC75_04605 [Nanoarchaeota archaeon]|nr:hypothetical protein [Nanoarchaeota archaeon]MBU1005402.1 hypothetical protein [Nanoarchaeota archaeon]MBU1946958.1 hypothetical protein [Nanoarchaeota archaeon]
MKRTDLFVLFAIVLLILPILIYTENANGNNKTSLEKRGFTKEDLQKIHQEVQNKIEESPQENISVLIKSKDYDTYLGKYKIDSDIRDIQGKVKSNALGYISV